MSEINVKALLEKEQLDKEEKIYLFDELYWTNWQELDKSPSLVEKAFDYMRDDNLSIEEISKILPLYNNPEGAHADEFSEITIDLYKKDRIKFLRALALNPDEAINLVYIFRLLKPFEDGDEELDSVREEGGLTPEEDEIAVTFFAMYKTICNT